MSLVCKILTFGLFRTFCWLFYYYVLVDGAFVGRQMFGGNANFLSLFVKALLWFFSLERKHFFFQLGIFFSQTANAFGQ